MASFKKPIPTIILSDVQDLVDCIKNEIMPYSPDPTVVIVPSISGTLDPFTEEIVFHTSDTHYPASGIVGAVAQEDLIYGLNGQIQVGDTKVTYEYAQISGVLDFAIEQVILLTPGVSGVYNIIGKSVDMIGDTPIFVDIALKPSRNG